MSDESLLARNAEDSYRQKDVRIKIPAEVQEKLDGAAAAADAAIRVNSRKKNMELIIAMQMNGLIVQPVTPSVEGEWRHLTEVIAPADIFDEVQRLVAEYRAGRKR
jgi:hypothetical protein